MMATHRHPKSKRHSKRHSKHHHSRGGFQISSPDFVEPVAKPYYLDPIYDINKLETQDYNQFRPDDTNIHVKLNTGKMVAFDMQKFMSTAEEGRNAIVGQIPCNTDGNLYIFVKFLKGEQSAIDHELSMYDIFQDDPDLAVGIPIRKTRRIVIMRKFEAHLLPNIVDTLSFNKKIQLIIKFSNVLRKYLLRGFYYLDIKYENLFVRNGTLTTIYGSGDAWNYQSFCIGDIGGFVTKTGHFVCSFVPVFPETHNPTTFEMVYQLFVLLLKMLIPLFEHSLHRQHEQLTQAGAKRNTILTELLRSLIQHYPHQQNNLLAMSNFINNNLNKKADSLQDIDTFIHLLEMFL